MKILVVERPSSKHQVAKQADQELGHCGLSGKKRQTPVSRMNGIIWMRGQRICTFAVSVLVLSLSWSSNVHLSRRGGGNNWAT